MPISPADTGWRETAQESTLADRLPMGALPLGYALRCATDVAAALRDLHERGQGHGLVDAAHVALASSGATLIGVGTRTWRAAPWQDVGAFGGILYSMLTGQDPPAGRPVPMPETATRMGPSGIRAGAAALAARCLNVTEDSWLSMARVLTEVRLLSVMAKQTPGCGQELETIAILAEIPERPKAAIEPPPPVRGDLEINCPRCGGEWVYRSKPRTRFERALGSLGVPLCRCHRCYYRFFRLLGISISKETLE